MHLLFQTTRVVHVINVPLPQDLASRHRRHPLLLFSPDSHSIIDNEEEPTQNVDPNIALSSALITHSEEEEEEEGLLTAYNK